MGIYWHLKYNMAKCPKCKSEINENSLFCPKCGQPISQRVNMQQSASVVTADSLQTDKQMPQTPKAQMPQPPKPKMSQAPKPQMPQPPKPQESNIHTNHEEKGFFNRLGAGLSAALTDGSFNQGYQQQREREHENQTLIQWIPMKLQDAQKEFESLKKKYPNIVESTDEIEFIQLVQKVQEVVANDPSRNVAQRNQNIKKAIEALEKKLYELRLKANSNADRNEADHRPHSSHISTTELHDINPDELAIVERKAIWGIQRGQIARRITERELDSVDGLNGVIIQQGCSAMIFVNGELVKVMESGAYQLQMKSDNELKDMIEKLTNQLMQNHKDKIRTAEEEEKRRMQAQNIAERGGLIGVAGRWMKRGFQFIFGSVPVAKRNNRNQELEAMKRFKAEAEKIVKEESRQPLLSVILISNRHFNLTFGGTATDDGIAFEPYVIPMSFLDVNIGIEIEMQINNISEFAINYLTDHNSLTTNDIFKKLNFNIENTLRQELRNQEYTQQGLDENIKSQLAQKLQANINRSLYGLECTQILNITDSQEDVFGRFRQVEKEIYCSEKELEFMTRVGEIRNRMEQEQNRLMLNSAQNAADYNQALLQIDKQGLLTADEREEFVQMLEIQKQIREAKTKEEAYEKLLGLEGNRLVKEDELEVIKDAIEHNKISRDEITNIMRIQSNRNVEKERLQAEWALNDSKQDHDWQREELERKRSWGLEDEEREREWMREEREYDRARNRLKAEDDYDFEKMMRMRNITLEDQARTRKENIEDENRAFEHQRQQMFDEDQIAANQSQRQMQNLEMAMKLQMMQEEQEQRHEQELASIKSNEQMNRDNLFANMTAEQIRAAQLSQLSSDAQVAAMNAYNSDKENELLRQQALKDEARAKEDREASAKEKENLMQFAMQMAGMVKDTAASVSGARLENQQQQIDQLRTDKRQAEARQEQVQEQAFGALGNVAAAAASNLYTQKTNSQIDIQQSAQEKEPEWFDYKCYNCGKTVRIYQGMPKCPNCGAEFQW